MKKKNLKNLRLNKSSISIMTSTLGGRKTTVEPPTTTIFPNTNIGECPYTMQDASWCWE